MTIRAIPTPGSEPSELGSYSTRRLLIWRIRVVMLLCVAGGFILGGKELLLTHRMNPQLWAQALGTSLATTTFFVLRQRWARRWAWPLSIFVVSFTYSITAVAGMLSPTGEYGTTAVLFVAATLIIATIVPWGMWGQLITVAVAAIAIGAGVLAKDGSLRVLITDPGAATVVAFALSIVTAVEVNHYRTGHRRELLKRRRGELAIIRLNAQLEHRVVERTAQLQLANETLSREAAERIESQQRLADIIDHSNAIISLKDTNGAYLLVNREFEALFEKPRVEVIGRTDRELFAPDVAQRMASRDDEVVHDGTSVSFEQELTTADGARAFVSVKFPLHRVDSRPYGVGTVTTDISRVKQLQDELRRHQDELAHVLRLHTISEMAAELAHEIHQPLCAITNYAQGGLHRLRAGAAPADLSEAFQHIAEEGLRAGGIIRGIRHLVQRISPPSEPIDVNALAAEAVQLLESRARRHGVSVRLECAPDLPHVWADGVQIEQVMVNLMLNGVEAIDGASNEPGEVVVATATCPEGVEVAVSDSGAGLAPEVAGKLFTPFLTTKVHGLGLGLAISRSIVELHGGQLWATANARAGMTFHFSLPTAAASVGA